MATMSRHTKKHELADRVKEIKQRQKNWMIQRAEAQSTEPSSEPQPKAKESAKRQDDYRQSEEASLQKVMASKKSRARFQNWLEAKEGNQEDAAINHSPFSSDRVYNSSNYSYNVYTDKPYRDHRGSNEVNVLRVPSSRSPGFASPDSRWDSEDETGELSSNKILKPEQFDTVADSIIARVKGEMGIKQSPGTMKSSNFNGLHNNKKDLYTGKVSSSKNQAKNKTSSELSNHVCPQCGNVMLPPSSSPTLLIPCGHTLCAGCSRRVTVCQICGCDVQSCTANIMLEQIITNFQEQQQRAEEDRRRKESNMELQRKAYKEEYYNLKTRKEILEEESASIAHSVQKLTRKLRDEHAEVEDILEQEKNVEANIAQLQEKLKSLVSHRQKLEHRCDELQHQSKQEKNKLALVQDSLKSVEQQLEKVSLLAENDL